MKENVFPSDLFLPELYLASKLHSETDHALHNFQRVYGELDKHKDEQSKQNLINAWKKLRDSIVLEKEQTLKALASTLRTIQGTRVVTENNGSLILAKIMKTHENIFTLIDVDQNAEDPLDKIERRLEQFLVVPPSVKCKIGEKVLAIFPAMTAFYPAIVMGLPHKENGYCYEVEFNDDDENGRTPRRLVQQGDIVPMPRNENLRREWSQHLQI